MQTMTFGVVHGCPVPLLRAGREDAGSVSIDQAAAETGRTTQQLQEIWDRVVIGAIAPDHADGGTDPSATSGGGEIEGLSASLKRLHRLYFSHVSEADFPGLLEFCRSRSINAWGRQVWADYRWDSNRRDNVLIIGLTIDGMRVLAHSTGQYAGCDAVEYEYADTDEIPARALATVYRIVNGERVAFRGEALWKESYPRGGNTEVYDRQPHGQLSRKAKAAALREAFPDVLSGIYSPEEFPRESPSAQRQSANKAPVPTQKIPRPSTYMQLHLLMIDLEISNERRRNEIIAQVRAVNPGLEDERLYQRVAECLYRSPMTYGAVLPEQVPAAEASEG